MNQRLISSVVLGSILVFQLDHFAQAVTFNVGDGGSVVNAVAAAANGDIIQINSNQTFVGSLFWFDKFITIQAGSGFHPTIKGNPFTPGAVPEIGGAAVSGAAGISGTGGLLKGLTFVHGDNGNVSIPPFPALTDRQYLSVVLVATATTFSNMTFQNDTFLSAVTVGGTGDFHVTASFEDNFIPAPLTVNGTGNLNAQVNLARNQFEDGLTAGLTGNAVANIVAVDNVFKATPQSAATTGIEMGIALAPSVERGRFVNNTVVGFAVGIDAGLNSNSSFENMLLANTDDVGTLTGTIANSLIADGTFAGSNGNFAASPLFGPQLQLLPGSPGIDAGNNFATGLPATDILGHPRILDGNGDSIARVDVGAYELAVPEPTAICLARFGAALIVIGGQAFEGREINRL